MSERDDELRIRPGRIRDGGGRSHAPNSFASRVMAAAHRAGHVGPKLGGSRARSTFGRGRGAALRARPSSRRVVVKTRIVRHRAARYGSAPLARHITYLERDGVSRSGEPARMFDAGQDHVDSRAFAERCEDDRHHHRFIVSPEDAGELLDLRATTRDLMTRMERDLGTKLDWVAADHWNTDNPHVHILLRGTTEDEQDLVISRDYLTRGLRSQAEQLVELELGPRTEREIATALDRDVEADRFTSLDRRLQSLAAEPFATVDLRLGGPLDADGGAKRRLLGRAAKLERLGLAERLGPAQWELKPGLEERLRELGERDDAIRTLNRALTRNGVTRGSDVLMHGQADGQPVIGRLVERGLHDELVGSAYAVIDGVDGRAHHVRFAELDATGDGEPGSIVELRRFQDRTGRSRTALAVRSDLPLAEQVAAPGATWLDRQLVADGPSAVADAGFGHEVQAALDRRAEHLVGEGLARRRGQQVLFSRDLLDTLRRRELEQVGERLSATTGLEHRPSQAGDHVAGTYRRRLPLASGRFAMIDSALGFRLVPWTPAMEQKLGQEVSGTVTRGGTVNWSFTRQRDLSL